jgi:hypothetical protein
VSAPVGPAPTIFPGLRRLDGRRRTLAFSIRTNGLPYFEVLLTTERALFDSANAGRRTPANFYASRQDGGLSRSTPEESAFVVPAAVMQRFANATPRPSEIFYTVAAYATPDGAPLLAAPPAVLAVTAPSVQVGGDFQAEALATVLAVPAEKLRLVGVEDVERPGAAPPREEHVEAYTAPEEELSPAGEAYAWSAPPYEGEEPEAAMALDALDDFAAHPTPVSLEEEAVEAEPAAAIQAAADEPADEEPPVPAEAEEEPSVPAAANDEPFDYDDGYGPLAWDDEPEAEPDAAQAFADDVDDRYDDVTAQAADSMFPPDATEPAALSDVEERRLDEELTEAAGYDDLYDEEMGAYEAFSNGSGPAPAVAAPPRELDIPAKIAVVTKLGRLFHGPEGFRSVSGDAQHGLRFGLIGFRQDRGDLGRLLVAMRERDAERFHAVFGADADELVRVTTQRPAHPHAPGERSPRLAPVGGHELWTEPWMARFRTAGEHPAFQAAQNELAVRRYLDPMIAVASRLGLSTERALALAVERALEVGPRRAQEWLGRAVGAGAPDVAQRMAAIVAAAAGEGPPWRERAEAIRTTPELGDGPLTWTPPAAAGPR